MKGNRIITIGRQIGSGGSEIGMEVAKRLGIQCYDRQLIEMACDYGELDQDKRRRSGRIHFSTLCRVRCRMIRPEEALPSMTWYLICSRRLSGGWQRRSLV